MLTDIFLVGIQKTKCFGKELEVKILTLFENDVCDNSFNLCDKLRLALAMADPSSIGTFFGLVVQVVASRGRAGVGRDCTCGIGRLAAGLIGLETDIVRRTF
jgi:hypothetical protein